MSSATRGKVLRVAASRVVLARQVGGELRGGELPHRLQQPEAVVAGALDEAVVQQLRERLQACRTASRCGDRCGVLVTPKPPTNTDRRSSRSRSAGSSSS